MTQDINRQVDSIQHVEKVANLFNLVSDKYDHPAMCLFPIVADKLVELCKPNSGMNVLDVGTGAGAVAIAFAQAIKPNGRVTAIDVADKMLAKATANIQKIDLQNIDVFQMNGLNLEFNNKYFDLVVGSFSLFFIPDMLAALKSWKRVTKVGGKVVFTSFAEQSFSPMVDLFFELLKPYSINMETDSLASYELSSPDNCLSLFKDSGFSEITVLTEKIDYHLNGVEDWWIVVENSGLRFYIDLLSKRDRNQFRIRYLSEIGNLVTDNGLPIRVDVVITSAIRSGE